MQVKKKEIIIDLSWYILNMFFIALIIALYYFLVG